MIPELATAVSSIGGGWQFVGTRGRTLCTSLWDTARPTAPSPATATRHDDMGVVDKHWPRAGLLVTAL